MVQRQARVAERTAIGQEEDDRAEAERVNRLDRRLSLVFAWLLLFLVPLGGLFYTVAHTPRPTPSDPPRIASVQPLFVANGAVTGTAPAITAKAAFVYDADLGFVFYSKNADLELPMASCTKIMTALLATERGSLDQMVTIGADAAALAAPGNSYMGVSAGERLSLRDLLYGLMLPSGNDAAVAIADAIGGNVQHFVVLMNARAQQLGLTHTHFANPHGLDAPGHYTSARDLAVLAAVAMRNPTLVQITSTKHYDIPQTSTHKAYSLVSGDDLIPGDLSPYPGAIGVKPGFTGAAGYCQAFAAIRRGHLIVGTVMGEPTWEIRITDMRTLLDWGYLQEGIPPAPSPVPWTHPPASE
jgi:serine-type D-Ala-D-Ala carboxypeptidase (penicillin-binding protein 5/6)